MIPGIKSVDAGYAEYLVKDEDYYAASERADTPLQFGGKLAEHFGKTPGTFDYRKFRDGIQGKFVDKDGGQIELRQAHLAEFRETTKDRKAVCAYDLVMTVGRSWGIDAQVFGNKDTQEIIDLAMQRTMDDIEARGMFRVRVGGKGDQKYMPAPGLSYTRVPHAMTRFRDDDRTGAVVGGDPDQHFHFLIDKYSIGPDGKPSAIDKGALNRKEVDRILKRHLAELARERRRAIYMTENGPELAGYTRKDIEAFSDGSRVMRQYIEDRCKTDPKFADFVAINGMAAAMDRAGRETKHSKKEISLPPEKRYRWWQYKAQAQGIRLEELRQRVEQAQERAREQKEEFAKAEGKRSSEDRQPWNRTIVQTVSLAVKHLGERRSKFTKGAIIDFAMQASEYTYSSEQIKAEIQRQLTDGVLMLRKDGRTLTTKALVENELAIEASYARGIRSSASITNTAAVERAIANWEREKGFPPTDGQRKAISEIIMGCNLVSVVEGQAGTGKTTCVQIAREIAKEAGWKTFGGAPTTKARDRLADSLGKENVKGTKFLIKSERWWKQHVDAKTILVLDEAGLIDSASLRALLNKAHERNARVVLVGDPRQYKSVESGSAMSQLVREAERNGSLVRLTEMIRARTDALRREHLLARDNPRQMIMEKFQRGEVKSFKYESAAVAELAKRYAALDEDVQAKTLIITGMNRTRIAINAAVRAELGVEGGIAAISFEKRDLTKAQLSMTSSYEVGDLVVATEKTAQLLRGQTCRVVEVDPYKDVVVLERANGSDKRIEFDPRRDGERMQVGTDERIQIAEGELIRFTGKVRGEDFDLINGDRARVVAIDEERCRMMIERQEDGQVTTIKLSEQPMPIRYGYAATGHSSQGDTVHTSGKEFRYVSAEDPTTTWNAIYTDLTRSTMHSEIFTDARGARKLDELLERVGVAQEEDRALENLPPIKAPELHAFVQSHVGPGDTREFVIYDRKNHMLEQLLEAKEKCGGRLHITGNNDEMRRQAIETALDYGIRVQWTDDRSREILRAVEKTRAETHAQSEVEDTTGPRLVRGLYALERENAAKVMVTEYIDEKREVHLTDYGDRIRASNSHSERDIEAIVELSAQKYTKGFEVRGTDAFKESFVVETVKQGREHLICNDDLQPRIRELVQEREFSQQKLEIEVESGTEQTPEGHVDVSVAKAIGGSEATKDRNDEQGAAIAEGLKANRDANLPPPPPPSPVPDPSRELEIS